MGDIDLSFFLAAPPSQDWIQAESAADVMAGPFDAQRYADYIQDGATKYTLNLYGFITGYGREFEQQVTQNYMVELVFEFHDSAGATDWFCPNSDTAGEF